MSFLGVIAFIVALLFSVMVHEFGHYLTAKRFNMKVTEFFLGFGKRIWSFRRGETEFGLKAIPAGGSCRIVGMSVTEEMTEEDKPRAFYTASAPKRLIVLGAGSFLHFVLGFLILVLLLGGVGTVSVTNKVGEVAPCILQSTSGASSTTCDANSIASPAKIAGIQAGDEIKAINGKRISLWSNAVRIIRASANKEIKISVRRGSQNLDFNLTPEARVLDGKKIGVIGVVNKIGTQRLSPIKTVSESTRITWELMKQSVTSLISLPAKIPELVQQTFGGKKRDSSGLVGVVGVARVSAQNASDPKLGTTQKISTFMVIIASLNIFVGIFNLLPLLPLDGGHMLIAVIDGYRRWNARRKGRHMPAAFDLERLMPLTVTVFALLAALSLLLLAADIFNPINLNQ